MTPCRGQLPTSQERIWARLRPRNEAFRWLTRARLNLVSASPQVVSLPSGGGGGVSGPSSGRSFPLPCPFPSPEISVLSLSYPSERVHIRQLQHSGQGLSRWEAYLMSDRHSNLSPGLEVQSPPISSPLFPCRQEKSPWEQGQAADFHTLEHTHLRVPKTMDPRLASVGSGQRGHRVAPPSLALSGGAQGGV